MKRRRSRFLIAFCFLALLINNAPAQNSPILPSHLADTLTLAKAPESKSAKKISCATPYIAPVILCTYGIIAIGPNNTFYDRFDAKRDVQKSFPGFHSTVDNYLQFVPAASVFTLSLCGVKGKHSLKEQVILYAGSMALSEGIATILKYSTHMLRPDGSANNSFPSGHTTSAFTGAEMLNLEYGSKSFVYPVLGYATAGATGFMRLMNNRHWMSDVLFGAGIGMISTKVIYAIYPSLKRRFGHTVVNAEAF